MRKLRAITSFYSSYAFAAIAISIGCCWITFFYGLSPFKILFWFKIATLVVIYFFVKNYKQQEFYYYANLGVSKKVLWVTSLSFDMFLFISMVALTVIYR